MHEMGITQGILAASFDAARAAGAEGINEIRVSIGDLTEVQEFALQFAFEALTPGTMAEGATLVVTHIAPSSRCNQCGTEYEHDRFQMVCPQCGSFNVTPLTGHELQVDSLETPDEAPDSSATGNATSAETAEE
jgi:hydrogenase nickel incorporation protein HypA/HybF